MAVEIVERDMSEPVQDMHGSDIAYDVHVRRVFLRRRHSLPCTSALSAYMR
jgi:hypothetical protein